MELVEGILSRRSVREFTDEEVGAEELKKILMAGIRAPSGLNNQPWRFVVVRSPEIRRRLAELTHYGAIVIGAPLCVAVFLDRQAVYHEKKDCQAIGACLENMLLAAHGLGLGGVWLGEILKNADQVRLLLDLPESLDLMALLALGRPRFFSRETERKGVEEVLLKEV